MTKDQKYKQELQNLGIYENGFDSVIHSLVILEKEQSRVRKELRTENMSGKYNSKTDKLYSLILKQERLILEIRESLGLTPKGLMIIKKGNGYPKEKIQEQPKTMLELIREKKSKQINFEVS